MTNTYVHTFNFITQERKGDTTVTYYYPDLSDAQIIEDKPRREAALARQENNRE